MNYTTKVIILDDDEDIGAMLKMMLEFKGYEVTLIDRVEKINEALTTGNYQLLILDMLIAGENGCDLCRQLKKDERFSTIPVLMFSALPDGKKLAMAAGADAFIAKPFQMNDMFEKVGDMSVKKKND